MTMRFWFTVFKCISTGPETSVIDKTQPYLPTEESEHMLVIYTLNLSIPFSQ